MAGEYVTVLSRADLPEGKTRTVEVAGRPLALCNVGGTFFAVDDTCPHAGASLGEGHMEGDRVICPLHDACFDVRTGEAVEGPAVTGVATYPVRLVGDAVQIAVPG
jgi:nitrite reductase/ring-hydroxylating ferredoxin subunit